MLAWKFPFQMQFLVFFGDQWVVYEFPFRAKFPLLIGTHPIHHILLTTPWKIEVGVLFLGGLPLLHF